MTWKDLCKLFFLLHRFMIIVCNIPQEPVKIGTGILFLVSKIMLDNFLNVPLLKLLMS